MHVENNFVNNEIISIQDLGLILYIHPVFKLKSMGQQGRLWNCYDTSILKLTQGILFFNLQIL